jgi:hypothetical protein
VPPPKFASLNSAETPDDGSKLRLAELKCPVSTVSDVGTPLAPFGVIANSNGHHARREEQENHE